MPSVEVAASVANPSQAVPPTMRYQRWLISCTTLPRLEHLVGEEQA